MKDVKNFHVQPIAVLLALACAAIQTAYAHGPGPDPRLSLSPGNNQEHRSQQAGKSQHRGPNGPFRVPRKAGERQVKIHGFFLLFMAFVMGSWWILSKVTSTMIQKLIKICFLVYEALGNLQTCLRR